jgi:tRNA 2-thiouridine synthesizing protein A
MASFDLELDTSGLNCPLPVLKARKALSTLEAGQRLHLIATDPGANKDIPAFCKMTGNQLVQQEEREDTFYFIVEKGSA